MFALLFKRCFAFVSGLILVALSLPFSVTIATADDVKWSPVPLPTEGVNGGWVLASGADTRYLTAAIDGTLYCYATPTGTTDTLFKSTDGGLSWHTTGQVKDTITAIAAASYDAATLYYATASRIYRSTDAGASFISLPPNPGGAGSGNIQITTLDVVRSGNSNQVAAGTRDTDAGQFGGLYLLDESSPAGVWLNTTIGNYDITRVVFSPDYANDGSLIAIGTDETDTFVRTRVADTGWSQIIGNARLPGIVATSAVIAFPRNYQAQGSFYAGIDTSINRGDVWRMTPVFSPAASSIVSLGIGSSEGLSGIDVTSLTIGGNTGTSILVAGCGRQTRTYTTQDGGAHWSPSRKPPTGQTDTWVAIAGGRLYAATCGAESAFSTSTDYGATWNQVSLIDGKISSLVDFTVVPAGAGTALFLVTHDDVTLKRSLWRSQDGGNRWQRVNSSSLPGVSTFNMVRATADGALFVSGQNSGSPVLWQSTDLGQTFSARAAPCTVSAWAFADKTTFYVCGFDGSKGLVYRTSNSGNFYSEPGEAGTKVVTSIVLSPDYALDKTILVGNVNGQVFISTDNGANFRQLGQQLPVTAGVGNVNLAFDRDFSKNGLVYAAVDTKVTGTSKERLFRFNIGTSTAWQSINGSLPVDAVMGKITISDQDTLYAVNGQGVVAADKKGGMVRSMTPNLSTPSFETMIGGLDELATLSGLWVYKNQLWSFDTRNTILLTLVDSLSTPVVLKLPVEQSTGLSTDIQLEWKTVSGAREYEWQVSDDTGFASLPAGFSDKTASGSVRISILKPGTTYYWRVRVSQPYQSPWSAVRSFTTLLGGMNVVPELSLPLAGSVTPVKPVFQWKTIPGADRYELLVSADATFTSPAVSLMDGKSIPVNAWRCDADLEYGTVYFWKVRACTATNSSGWSAVSVFTTEPAPVVPVTDGGNGAVPTQPPVLQVTVVAPQPQPQPVYTQTTPVTVQFSIPDWAMYCGLVLLLVIALLLSALLAVLIVRRR